MNVDLIHLLYPIQYELWFLYTTRVWAGSLSRNFTIPAPAKSFGSLRLRLHNTGQSFKVDAAPAIWCTVLSVYETYLFLFQELLNQGWEVRKILLESVVQVTLSKNVKFGKHGNKLSFATAHVLWLKLCYYRYTSFKFKKDQHILTEFFCFFMGCFNS